MAESMTDGIFLARPETAAEGIPLAVKDLFDTAGLDDHVRIGPLHRSRPAHTAEAVTLLEAAGYANAGKANLHEFAYGVTSENPHFGAVPNPLRTGASPAARAAARRRRWRPGWRTRRSAPTRRLDPIPAAAARIVGFKADLRPRLLQAASLAPSWDHAGPMARTSASARR